MTVVLAALLLGCGLAVAAPRPPVRPRDPAYAGRGPLERAVLSFVPPFLLPSERSVLAANRFQVACIDFDWSLNDLGTR